MRKLMIAAALVLGSLSAASAAEVVGTISAVDPNAHTVTLTNGQTFRLFEGQNTGESVASNFRAGDKVKIQYQQLNLEPTATAITVR
jgi:opacity protein-like surface antigen